VLSAFISAVGWTVYRTKEYTPEELESFEEAEKEEIVDKDILREVSD